ncbi:hypothetical protein AB0D68_25505 [Streptomyces sp. NPDC048212]|uniref:hypothetical protein n=1 Tax=Streptomyces TaxID=1883 RepID=UPI0022742FA1|nr:MULTISPECIES: hypothetical protein [unclassified Streptomyces]MCY1649293.1 hypothetical protein [Streptomyces sp. SL203]MCY1677005.1 hypothetical protein [Streptomyces sp. SL294]
MAGVGRAAIANWLRRHGGLEAVGGTKESPLFPRAAAEQWLRDLDKVPAPGPAEPREPATVTFAGGPALTVYGPELRSPALPAGSGVGYEEFGGFIEPDRPGIPWPTASARIEQPGHTPYEVVDAHVDISSHGGPMEFLLLTWPAARGRDLPAPTETTEALA